MNLIIRSCLLVLGLLFLWQIIVWVFHLPPYILPSPWQVFQSAYQHIHVIAFEFVPTLIEILLGLALATLFGCLAAIVMTYFRPLTLWVLPILIISQAIPTFALAPILVIWLGYGMSSKIATVVIMLFFPIASAFFDGLQRTEPGWLDLATTMNAKKWRTFWNIRIPAALPNLASGLRVATALAPLGAIISEWVGASRGLGYLMMNSNARMQIDLMFAALFVIVIFSLVLYFVVDKLLRLAVPWQEVT